MLRGHSPADVRRRHERPRDEVGGGRGGRVMRCYLHGDGARPGGKVAAGARGRHAEERARQGVAGH